MLVLKALINGGRTRDVANFLIGFSIDSEPNKTRVIMDLKLTNKELESIGKAMSALYEILSCQFFLVSQFLR